MRLSINASFLLALLLALASPSQAQPAVDTLWLYDNNISVWDMFADIYHCDNGDFLLCGQSSYRPWVLRVNHSGERIWSYIIDGTRMFSVIEADNGDAISVGTFGGGFGAVRLDHDGEEVWRQTYGVGRANGIIELKEGDFVICGFSGGQGSEGKLVRIQGNGEVVWNRTYRGGGGTSNYQGLRETEDGIVAVGNTGSNGWLQKVDLDGAPVWSRSYNGFQGGGLILWEMVSTPHGFALAGPGQGPDGFGAALIFVDRGGDVIHTEYFGPDDGANWCECLALCSDGGVVLVGYDSARLEHPWAIRTDRTGHKLWSTRLGEYVDNQPLRQPNWQYNQFYGVIVLPGDTIVACGTLCNTEGLRSDGDGLVVMLAPDRLVPEVWLKSPGDSLFEILRGSEVQFTVQARDHYDRDLEKSWIREDSLVGGNVDSVRLFFPNVGVEDVRCVLHSLEGEFATGWSVTVSDFFISSHLPVNQSLGLRRNHPAEFKIEVSTNFDDSIRYSWILSDLLTGNAEVVSEADSAVIQFDHPGSYTLQAVAEQGNAEDEFTWSIEASSVIWSYWPDELHPTATVDSTLQFGATPSNPDSDSLTFLWTLDGDTAGLDSAASIKFSSEGEHSVVLVAREGSDADTVSWTVSVEPAAPPEGVENELGRLNFDMDNPIPNPFNNFTRVNFIINPTNSGTTSLFVYGLDGRLVKELVNGRLHAGRHSVVFDGSGMAAGVYLLRLEAGGEWKVAKVVLVK